MNQLSLVTKRGGYRKTFKSNSRVHNSMATDKRAESPACFNPVVLEKRMSVRTRTFTFKSRGGEGSHSNIN